MVTLIGIIFIALSTFITWALCRTASTSDMTEEEILREQLYKAIEEKGLGSPEVLVLSQELDIAIIKKQRELINK